MALTRRTWMKAAGATGLATVAPCLSDGDEKPGGTSIDSFSTAVVQSGTLKHHGRVCRNFRLYWPTVQVCFDDNLERDLLLVMDNSSRVLAIDFCILN